jgi:hypothetical protein
VKKIATIAIASFAMMVMITACGGSPAPIQKSSSKVFYDIVDHKGMALGKEVPDWVLQEANDLEKQDQYKTLYLFKFEETGKNLDATKTWANNFSAPSEISKIVTTRVQQKFAGAQAGDKDKLGNYFENVVKTLSQAEYSGAQKVADWWLLKQYRKNSATKAGQQEYTYYLLYGIPKDTLNKLVQDQLDKARDAIAATPEQATAIDRVKQAFTEGF